jgi:ankyrin repeat protein
LSCQKSDLTSNLLCGAIRTGIENSKCEKLIRILAALDIDLNQKGLYGTTPLYLAVEDGRIESVKLLASLGADVNIPQNNGETPMHEALFNQNCDMIQTLFFLHATYTPADLDEALDRAVQRGDEDKVRLLVCSFGAEINKSSTRREVSPLRATLFNGNLSMIKFLIKLGAQVRTEDVNAPNQFGQTPLHTALANTALSPTDRVALVRFLASLGADCNLPDREGNSPLGIANGFFFLEEAPISQCLIDHGADKELFENIQALKSLAHSWTLGGEGTCYNTKTHTFQDIPVTGWYPLSSLKLARKLFRDFVEEKMKPMGPYYQELGEKILTILNVSLECRTSVEPSKEIIRLSEKEPVVFMGGSQIHAIGYILQKNKMYICNRGERMLKDESPGIKGYEFNRELQTELHSFVKEALSTTKSLKGLETAFTALAPRLIKETLQREQKVGNCTWTNIESVLFALLLILTETQNQPKEKWLAAGKQIYKLFTKYAREKTLRSYLQFPKPDLLVLRVIEVILDTVESFSEEEKKELLGKIDEKIRTSNSS